MQFFSLFLLFYITFLPCNQAKAWLSNLGNRKIAIIIGGGGETRNFSSTIFDNDYLKLSRTLKHRGYETYVSFGGANPTLNEITRRFHKQSWPGTQESFDTLTDAITLQLSKNEIKVGDQIIIFVVGHGAKREPGSDRKAHRISFLTEDLKSDSAFELEQLRRIISFAEDKKVKVALVDSSCYSGYSLELASETTCVLTSSTQKTLGYYNFLDELLNVAYFDLEQMFLLSRKHVHLSQPEISTEAHKKVRNNLWFLENYFMFNLWKINALYFRNPWEPCFCEDAFLKLLIQDSTEKYISPDPNQKKIENATDWNKFRTLASKIVEQIQQTIAMQKQIPRTFRMSTEIFGEKIELTNHALYYFVHHQAKANQDQFARVLKKSGFKISPEKFWSFVVTQTELVKSEDEYRLYENYLDLQRQLDLNFYQLTLLERKVYDEQYRKEKKSNACSKFQF